MGIVRFDKIAKESRGTYGGSLEGMPIVGLEHIEPYDMLLKNWDVDVETTFTKEFHKGQIMFGRRRAYQHKACVATCDGICSGDITLIEPIEGMVYPDLLPFIVQNDDFFEHAIKGSNGALSPRVKWEHMANFEVNLPSLAEQKVLAEKLWAAYDVKQSYLNMIEATQEMIKSQFIEMHGDKVPKKKISEVCDVRGGSTPTRTIKEYWENGTVSWFTVEDIYDQGRYIHYTKQHITELATRKCFVYPIDTVLICCTASVGEYALTKKEMASNQQFNGMMVKDKSVLRPEYLLYVASTLKDVLLRQAGKTTINFVSRSKLEEIEIPIPSIETQDKFISIKHQADKSEFELRKSIDAIDKVIKSLINENL